MHFSHINLTKELLKTSAINEDAVRDWAKKQELRWLGLKMATGVTGYSPLSCRILRVGELTTWAWLFACLYECAASVMLQLKLMPVLLTQVTWQPPPSTHTSRFIVHCEKWGHLFDGNDTQHAYLRHVGCATWPLLICLWLVIKLRSATWQARNYVSSSPGHRL